jgi:tetratricopeptide (TPR) repeat protein
MTLRTLTIAAVVVAAISPAANAQTPVDPSVGAEIARLQASAKADPSQPAVLVRLSQAYAVANQPRAALEAIEGALALDPMNAEYLHARAILATWATFYGRARDSYKALAKVEPADAEVTLNYARVSAWAGDTDRSVGEYRKYLALHPEAKAVWLELARTESWRGNYAVALDELNNFHERFGESPERLTEVANVLANAGRPSRAEEMVRPLLEATPDNAQLNLTRTVALARQQRARDAFESLAAFQSIGSDPVAIRSAERVLRAELASTAEPRVSAYSDSDNLSVQRFAPTVTLALSSGTRISGGYERTRLSARMGSGLEQFDGSTTADVTHIGVGALQKMGRLSVGARIGQAAVRGRERTTYTVAAEGRPIDTLFLAAERSEGLFIVSPRTVGLGMTQLAHRAHGQLSLGMRYHVAADVLHQDLSDGNTRLEVNVSSRRSMARRARFNLDLGASAYVLETSRDMDNGYYDPRRYEFYAINMFPYFKLHENVGLAMTLAGGPQRDTISPSFKFGGTVSGEATFGIYAPWLLKVNGSATMNQRLDSGAFRGLGGSVALVRRF